LSRSIPTIALTVMLLGLTAPAAQADLIITLGDAFIAPGDTGTLDISVASTGGDTLSAFGMELLITKSPTASSFLQFTTNQPDPTGHANYVFLNHSAIANSGGGLPFFSLPLDTNYSNDTILAADTYDPSPGYVTIDSMHSYLGTVQFQIPMGAMLGDQFQISLVNDPNFTYFEDKNGDNLTVQAVLGGTVTVAGTTAVPEPSTLALSVVVAGGLFVAWRRRRAGTSRGPSAVVTPGP
jgi:hypothetical protein